MCGIAGILVHPGVGPSRHDLDRMLARIEHRGPDDVGSIVLGSLGMGMRRLSILDTSDRGHQPMQSASGRSWIVFNGEIYNFLELTEELQQLGHIFRSASDTEVLLAAYEAWGIRCVERLNGIWAFAIWDTETEELHLSRDRFGVKPLFMAERGGRIAFASEIKAIVALDWIPAEPDEGVLKAFLVDGLSDHVDRTSFEGIERLPAATVRSVNSNGVRDYRYWGPPELSTDASFRSSKHDQRMVDDFRGLLVDAVALQLRSDVALGSCLSGGIDSSSIVAIASALESGALEAPGHRRPDRRASQRLAFFADFDEPGISERRFVDEVVAATGVELVRTTPGSDDLAAVIGRVVTTQDEPFGSTSIVAQYFVMEAARRSGVKVLLDGQGADEIMGGYPQYVAMRYAGALRADGSSSRAAARMVISRQVKPLQTVAYAVLGSRPLPPTLRRFRLDRAALGPRLRDARAPQAIVATQPGTVLGCALWRQIASENLPALLRFEDRNSMAFGIKRGSRSWTTASWSTPCGCPTDSRSKAPFRRQDCGRRCAGSCLNRCWDAGTRSPSERHSPRGCGT